MTAAERTLNMRTGNKGILTNVTICFLTLILSSIFILATNPSTSSAEELLFSKFAYEAMKSWTKEPNKGHLKITTEIICTVSGYDIITHLTEDSTTNEIQVKNITGYILDDQKMVDSFFIKDTPKLERGSTVTLSLVHLSISSHYWVGLEVVASDGQVFKYVRQLPDTVDMAYAHMTDTKIGSEDGFIDAEEYVGDDNEQVITSNEDEADDHESLEQGDPERSSSENITEDSENADQEMTEAVVEEPASGE